MSRRKVSRQRKVYAKPVKSEMTETDKMRVLSQNSSYIANYAAMAALNFENIDSLKNALLDISEKAREMEDISMNLYIQSKEQRP